VIVAAAREILRAEGIDGLSMRRLATVLETGPASLYAHVANKDELLEMLFDEVMGDIPLPEPDPARWRELVTRLWTDSRDVMVANGDIARVSLGHIPVGDNTMKVAEATVALLRAGGVPEQAAGWAVDVVGSFVTACAIEDAGRSPEEQKPEFYERYTQYFTNLPPERFPVITSMAAAFTAGDAEQRFRFGLELLVGGLAALVPPGE
jgi:AcrR family transcriptional regulator